MAHILTIEDDSMIAALERDFLEASGFEVTVAMSGKEGLKVFDGGAIDAVLLDVGLPDTDGFSVCRKIRDISNVPIIFITARGSDEDKIKGLGLGADDYIVKPFNPSEMTARLKAHLDIHQRLLGARPQALDENKPDIQVEDLRIYIKRHQVFRGKKEIMLTGKEFNLLLFLARHPNQVFSKKYLFEMIWHLDALGELATVTVHVNRLRDKLNEIKPEFTAIETVWGNGYRFRVEE
ncbi:transcriptional regulator [Megasphaera cerevisiae DSM 20462]|jgi:DNA-binding response OmpR family regulator|uniref:Transcriptional regulator n=1 Tax=Megasphaera cerevisiae DSM 20462 TaxID=1122219 RepID=A0A0J6WYE2_9FIRM|nr:response regulator transcription factor [Megasphaera cerevisiae]KMO87273.1 transcriptional regulator [Megasphaera cerevisiae DSM 20462]OKY54527.1 DNA-binding response regulator [Megasphaera cerevisiae]SJZ49284.1 DNA-binding response regulator, OmpR family, contains REC and winged-helix (wHTH) domain [Megasphaera cerevisiae DSM 20462]